MRFLSRILFLSLLLAAVLGTGCDYTEEEESDYYNFKVISQGGAVSGYYIVDGGDIVDFTTSLETSLYVFKKNLSSPTSIRVVTRSSTSVSSVEIFVYQNSKEVDYAQDSITATGDAVYASLYYEFEASTTTSK